MKLVIALLLVFSVAVTAAQAPTPTLTEEQKLRIQNAALRVELLQMRAQQAVRDYEQSRSEMTALLESLKVDGFTLDLSTLSYTKEPPK